VPGRALVGISSAMLATGMLTGCGAVNDQWDLPMSPLERPSDVPLDNRDVCATLRADPIPSGCKLIAESGTAEVIVIPQLKGDLRRYSDLVDGEFVRWVGISRFPAIQLASTAGTDGVASCRVALDVAPGQILLIVYRQQAADPRLAPCRPARDFATKALAELQGRTG
jgi:hypothetical protein